MLRRKQSDRQPFMYPSGAAFVLLLGFVMLGRPSVGVAATPPGASAAPPARTSADIRADLNKAIGAMGDLAPTMEVLYDPASRAKVGVQVLPMMRQINRLIGELSAADPAAAEGSRSASLELLTWMAVLGDVPAEDELRRQTVLPDPTQATDAMASLILSRWVRAGADALAQEKHVIELSKLARSQPMNVTVAKVVAVMTDTAATPALAQQAENVVVNDLKHPAMKEMAAALAAKRRLRNLEGKPLTIHGTTVDGADFSSASWKGKVVLVYFWATWCPPCRADMPALAKFYAEQRAAGFEMLGISSDRDIDDLKGYQAEHPEMAWPQLFDPAHPGQHPLVNEYGVDAMPTMFVIDRKGIVRSVRSTAANYKDLTLKLLAEK